MTTRLKGGGNPRQLSKKLNWPVKHRGLGWRHVLEVGICALITQPPSLMAPRKDFKYKKKKKKLKHNMNKTYQTKLGYQRPLKSRRFIFLY